MTDPLAERLVGEVTGEVTAQADLRPFTTLKVGGPARVLVEAETDADLAAVGRACVDLGVPWLIVGRGSNLLVADRGWHGVAITLGRGFRGVERDGNRVTVGGAEPLPVLANQLAREGLTGFEFASAVPGSVGGAVRMNAGAHGSEMADVLVSTDVVRLRTGARETWPREQLRMRYRHTDLPDDAVVVSAVLSLAEADADTISEEIAQIRQWRRDHQPINEPNCGSVFTNPEGDSAGRLVDACGAKGLTVGGAQVSEMHANFIVTRPEATAADVRALIRSLRERVAAEHGVWLRPEVVMVGDFADEGLGGPQDAARG